MQYALELDIIRHLDKDGQQHVPSVAGTFLFYGQAVELTTLPALNGLGTQQSAPTEQTIKDTGMLLDYMHTYPNAKLRFGTGNMQISIDFDTAYLVLPGRKSCFAGHFYLKPLPNALNYHVAPNNTPIHTKC
eukprot:9256062-Ditylum_brightwellii.AAC.1